MKFQFLPYFKAYDTGSGAGGSETGQSSQGQGQGGGSGSGQQQQQGADRGGTGGGGGGGGTPYKLTDDAVIDFGDGKPVAWKDARTSRFVPKEDHDKYVQSFQSARPMLESYAKQLDEGFAKLRAAQAQGQGQNTRTAAPRDIADEIAELPILDGQAGARMIKALREQGLGPIAQMLTTQQGQIKQLTDRLTTMQGATSTVFERHQNQDFETHVTDNLKQLGELKTIGAIDVNNPAVRELAKDLWGAYDAKTWTIPEYQRMLKERIEGFVTLVLESQKKQVTAAKEGRRKAFFNPNRGGGNPQGDRGYAHMDGLGIARASGIFEPAA